MLSAAQDAVTEFYKKFDLPFPSSPTRMNARRSKFVSAWIIEEARELESASTIEDQADAFADILYFAMGGFVELGLDAGKVFGLVHRANMKRKTGKHKVIRHHRSGKILKPRDWKSPVADIRKLVSSISQHQARS